MSSQHLTDDLCLDYLTGDLPVDEKQSFETHLNECSQCRQTVEEYRTILRSGVSTIAGEVADDLTIGSVTLSIEEGEKRLYAAIETQAGTRGPLKIPKARLANFLLPSNLWAPLAAAASLVLAFALGISIYRIGVKRGQERSQAVVQPQSDDATWRAQLESLANERDQVQARFREREIVISGLKAQLKEQRRQNEELQTMLQSAGQEVREQTEKASVERNTLARKVEDEQGLLTATEKKLDALEQAKTSDALRVTSLENQIHFMSQLLKDKDASIDEQQRFLASDRDIRDLMGARDLYIAEVYDVGGNGKRKRPYGRVFYTKGKSLIFYAYDLDQQPGVKNASTFQAWGLRGPDRSTALNLGVMYIDNTTNRRWMLRIDDPEALKKINAVFVTVEPNGGSPAPRGKQVLFAYLGEEPNHP
jgi:anti-sigma-K factor RskA